MLSQSRRLDVVANNMTNVATPGYKGETYTDTTFDEVVISLIGNKDKSHPQELGTETYILAPSQLYVDYTQGAVEETGMSLDFAIEGDGFFAIQTNGGVRYTRNGGFALDEEGYLCLPSTCPRTRSGPTAPATSICSRMAPRWARSGCIPLPTTTS